MPTPIRDVRDTFAHFLADNLVGISVHLVRDDPGDQAASSIQSNCVNIEYLNTKLDTIGVQNVCIDVINDDENTAVDWVTSVWAILNAAFYTPLYNYSTPSTPVAQHSNIMWDRNSVVFKRIKNNNYTHYSCTLPLQFTAII